MCVCFFKTGWLLTYVSRYSHREDHDTERSVVHSTTGYDIWVRDETSCRTIDAYMHAYEVLSALIWWLPLIGWLRIAKCIKTIIITVETMLQLVYFYYALRYSTETPSAIPIIMDNRCNCYGTFSKHYLFPPLTTTPHHACSTTKKKQNNFVTLTTNISNNAH